MINKKENYYILLSKMLSSIDQSAGYLLLISEAAIAINT